MFEDAFKPKIAEKDVVNHLLEKDIYYLIVLFSNRVNLQIRYKSLGSAYDDAVYLRKPLKEVQKEVEASLTPERNTLYIYFYYERGYLLSKIRKIFKKPNITLKVITSI